MLNFSFIELPSFASATNKVSSVSVEIFFSNFFNDFGILPSTEPVMAAKATVVSSNL